MIQKKTLSFLYIVVFLLLISVFFLQFSIREEKDTLNTLSKKIEQLHDDKQMLRSEYSTLTSAVSLGKKQEKLFPERTILQGEKNLNGE